MISMILDYQNNEKEGGSCFNNITTRNTLFYLIILLFIIWGSRCEDSYSYLASYEWRSAFGVNQQAQCVTEIGNTGDFVIGGVAYSGIDILAPCICAFLVKFSVSGTVIWGKSYCHKICEILSAQQQIYMSIENIIETKDGGLAAIGKSELRESGFFSYDVFFAKFTSLGELEWISFMSQATNVTQSLSNDHFKASIQEIDGGGYLFTSYYLNSTDFSSKYIWGRIDINGSSIWTKGVEFIDCEVLGEYGCFISWGNILALKNGGFVLIGSRNHRELPLIMGYSMVIVKLDAEGSPDWFRSISTPDKWIFFPRDIKETKDGGIVVLGIRDRGGLGTSTYLLKLDIHEGMEGRVRWMKSFYDLYTGKGSTFGVSVEEEEEGTLLISGQVRICSIQRSTNEYLFKFSSDGIPIMAKMRKWDDSYALYPNQLILTSRKNEALVVGNRQRCNAKTPNVFLSKLFLGTEELLCGWEEWVSGYYMFNDFNSSVYQTSILTPKVENLDHLRTFTNSEIVNIPDFGVFGLEVEDSCKEWMCFGKRNSAGDVCSEHGICSSPDNCTCSTGYLEDDCSTPSCFGIPKSSDEVCSGHGDCVSPDQCDCVEGYMLPYCHITKCFGINLNDSFVCGGNGKCISFNKCDCQWIYGGSECKSLETFGIVLGSSLFFIFLVCVCCCVTFICCVVLVSSTACCGWNVNRFETARKLSLVDAIKSLRSGDDKKFKEILSKSGSYEPISYFREKEVVEEFRGDPDGEGEIFASWSGKSWLVFKGSFQKGKKEGKGAEYFHPEESFFEKKGVLELEDCQNQILFEGLYRDGERNGRGIEYSRQGKSFEGIWEKGEVARLERGFVDLEEVNINEFQFDRIKDRIGSGAEGDVFSVEYKGRDAALKILRRQTTSVIQRLMLQKKFLRSQMIWSKVHFHPNILTLFCWSGIRSSDSTLGYCMQRCDGSLADFVSQKKMNWETKIRILYEICVAMEYLHGQSIMHRDLKPGNVLIDEFDKPQLCDFEMSRYDDVDFRMLMSNKSIIGTPAFVAPEVLDGGQYTKSCDVFSFGILVYCVYFDVLIPYKGIDHCDHCGVRVPLHEITAHVVRCGMRPAIKDGVESEMDWLLEDVMKVCWKKNPRERRSFSGLVEVFKMNLAKKKRKIEIIDEKTPILNVNNSSNVN